MPDDREEAGPRRTRSGRWAYMGREGHNPPSRLCPECTDPSKAWYIGAKSVDGATHHRYRCEHGHSWIVVEGPGPEKAG